MLFTNRLWTPSLAFAIGLIVSTVAGGVSSNLIAQETETAGTLSRQGNHLTLVSDVDDPRLLDDIVQSFDEAVPQWLAFWDVPADRAAAWHVTGYLMKNVDAFRRSGQLPTVVRNFQDGYASPSVIWMRHQDTAYYNRHLVLHEGVHSLAYELFGAGGPSWYMEGTAELLSLHRDRVIAPSRLPSADNVLAQSMDPFVINRLPRTRLDTPGWGRYLVVAKRREAGTLPSLKSVLKLPMELNGQVESYTWCWAAASLFNQSPDTRRAFLAAARRGADQTESFTSQFYRDVADQWPVLSARWRLMLYDLDYGFDWSRHQVQLTTKDPRANGSPIRLEITPDQGWQSAGVWFPKGARLNVTAAGECNVTPDWQSEPTGITVQYHRNEPLGQLQVCVLPIAADDGVKLPPLDVRPVIDRMDVAEAIRAKGNPSNGVRSRRSIEIREPSWVLFRINLPAGHSIESTPASGYQVKVIATR